MITPQAAVLKRLALVALVMGGFVSVHLGLAAQTTASPARAQVEAVASPAPQAVSEYGMGSCSEDGPSCATEYCAAPSSSVHDGYAVPCGRNAG